MMRNICKIKFNFDYDLPIKKTLELYNWVIVFRFFFHGVFLDECLYKLKILTKPLVNDSALFGIPCTPLK